MPASKILVDRSVNANPGIVIGNAVVSGGIKNGAFTLNGVDEKIVVPNDGKIKISVGTISAWIKPTAASLTGFRGIVAKQSAYGMFLNDGEFGMYDWGANVWRGSGVSSASLMDGNWHHVACTFNAGAGNGTVCYVDGIARLTTTIGIENQDEHLMIGEANANQYFAGGIDDVRVYNRALTAVEVAAVMNEVGIATEPTPVSGTEWYASVSGSVLGNGTFANPWDLKTALAGGDGRIAPGDTLYLKGGRYEGEFISFLRGTAASPITVRSAPREWAHLASNHQKHVLETSVLGAYVRYRDFEISGATGIGSANILLNAPYTKYINLILHDAKYAIYSNSSATESELYGLVVYNGGQGPNLHAGVRLLNDGPLYKTIEESIFAHNAGEGLAAYTVTVPVKVARFLKAEGNIFISNQNGEVFNSINNNAVDQILLQDNYFLNSFMHAVTNLADRVVPPLPTRVVRQNKYDPNRAHIIISNPSGAASVNVDISSLNWPAGATYVLRNAENYFGDTIPGTVSGSTINIPVTGRSVATVSNVYGGWGTTSFPQMGAFVIIRTDIDATIIAPPVVPPTPTTTPTPNPVTPPAPVLPAVPQYNVGDRITTTENLNVRNLPTLTASAVATVPLGTAGTIISGPVVSSGFTWYQIEYQTIPAVIGWSVSEFITGASPIVSVLPPSSPTAMLTSAKTGFGSGTVVGSGINCGVDCAEVLNANVSVTLNAVPANNSIFTGWSGACSGTSSCVVTMNNNKTATANFDLTSPVQPLGFSPSVLVMWATVAESPASINIHWAGLTGSSKIYKKTTLNSAWGNPIAELPETTTSYLDTSVQPGRPYWYRVERLGDNADIKSAILLPINDSRGRIILVVENSLLTAASEELSLLNHDLVADGWNVSRIAVARNDSPVTVKNLIKAEYDKAPTETKVAYLLGHVPVPYSGFLAGDGHADHYGAWSTDLYYADLDGVWTDTATRFTEAGAVYPDTFKAGEGALRPENRNFPGDGKFDQNYNVSSRDLAVGRVDFSNMPQFLPRTETYLIKQYIRKTHAFRYGLNPLPETGFIHTALGFGSSNGYNAQKSLSSAFTPAKIARAIYPDSLGQGALVTYLDSTAYFEGLNHVLATTEFFSRNDPPTFFYGMFGSYFGDFDVANNLLRAPLAGSRHGLTNVWGAYRYQGFGLGEAIGESLLPHQDTSRLVTNNLMGDPTLRLHALPVPQNLHFALSNGHLSLQWESIPNAIGYHVYRASQSTGRYERLTTDPILGNSFEDLTVGSDTGTYSYMIRALALHVSGEGSYVNASSGIIRVANLTRNGSGTIEVQEINPTPALAPLPTPDPVDLTPRTPTIFPISITPSTPRPGDEVTITYRFNPGPTDKSYNVYTHFWSGGIMRFTDEHRFPVPSNQWTENATYDVRLRIPTSAPPGDYKVNVGMFLGGERPEFIPGQGVIVEAEKYYRVGTLTVLPALVSISNAQINPVSVLEGENVHITWDSLDVDFVNIIRQINNQDHQVVASGIPNTGSFDWTATSVPGTVDMTFKIAKTDSDIIYAVSPSLAVVDTLAPESPSGVTAELKDASTIRYIEVKWVPGANSNAVTYKVYRSQISGVYSSPESEVYESVDYIIGPPSGRNFITVTALDLLGNESARSSEVFVDVPQVGASPGISDISDQTTSLNMPVNAIPFTVGDNETAANNLVLYITSNNSVLITPNDVSVSGAGANRTVTLTPSRDKIGSSVVTIYVMDQDHNTASESFVLTVNSVIQPTPTPTPTPVPPTIPSGLVVGDAVVTTSNLNVRNLPSTTATSLGTAPLGTSGTIISGPISANGFTWYQVSYASTPVLNGWSAAELEEQELGLA